MEQTTTPEGGATPSPKVRKKGSKVVKHVRVRAQQGVRWAKGHPVKAAGIGGGLLGLLYLLNRGGGMSSQQEQERGLGDADAMSFLEEKIRSMQLAKMLEGHRNERAVQMNRMALEQGAPDLYAGLMAGRALPPGGVALGGRPREDLIRAVAARMGQGGFDPSDEDVAAMSGLL